MSKNCNEILVDQKEYGFGTEQLVVGFQSLAIEDLDDLVAGDNSESVYKRYTKFQKNA
jgi:hypothetical protein